MQYSSAIPGNHALAGTGFTITVYGNGSPGTNDIYLRDGTQYPITSGN